MPVHWKRAAYFALASSYANFFCTFSAGYGLPTVVDNRQMPSSDRPTMATGKICYLEIPTTDIVYTIVGGKVNFDRTTGVRK